VRRVVLLTHVALGGVVQVFPAHGSLTQAPFEQPEGQLLSDEA
jgi:hypothetical protein